MARAKNWRYKIYKGTKLHSEATTKREAEALAARIGGRVKDTNPARKVAGSRGYNADFKRGYATALSVLGLYDPKRKLPKQKNPESTAFLQGYATAMRYYGDTGPKGRKRKYRAGKKPKAAYRPSAVRTRRAPVPYIDHRYLEDPTATRYIPGMRAKKASGRLHLWVDDYKKPAKKVAKKRKKAPAKPKTKGGLGLRVVHGPGELKKILSATRKKKLNAQIAKKAANAVIVVWVPPKGKWKVVPMPKAASSAQLLKLARKVGVGTLTFKVSRKL